MKTGKKMAGIIFIILFTYMYAHVAKTDMIYDKQTDSSDYLNLGELTDVVEQQFVCDMNSLDAIAVKCQLVEKSADAKVCMTLTDVLDNQIKATVEMKADALDNGKFNTFAFDKIEACKGRAYIVSFEGEGGVVFFCQPETEKNTRLTVGGEQREGTIIMKTVTNGFDIETFVVLLLIILFIVSFFKLLIRLFSR